MAGIMPKMAGAQDIKIKYKGNTATLIVDNSPKYLILPVEESMPEAKVKLDRHLDGRAIGAKKKRLPRAFRTERRQEVGGEDWKHK